jgi:hypothetical protein
LTFLVKELKKTNNKRTERTTQTEVHTPMLAQEGRENLTKVRNVIEFLDPSRFNMAQWNTANSPNELAHKCETAGCIGGWAEPILLSEDETAQLLGLSPSEGYALFYPSECGTPEWVSRSWQELKPKHAVQVIDHLLGTGKVDWSVITQ